MSFQSFINLDSYTRAGCAGSIKILFSVITLGIGIIPLAGLLLLAAGVSELKAKKKETGFIAILASLFVLYVFIKIY
ncbi:DUF3953 domain-containing protein [Metabacillus idriensis]|uniref:DUF3953 domain-containing protein n=1 Tax=Metabacillus idriensis TaxID=324768 RepID=UPI003D817620